MMTRQALLTAAAAACLILAACTPTTQSGELAQDGPGAEPEMEPASELAMAPPPPSPLPSAPSPAPMAKARMGAASGMVMMDMSGAPLAVAPPPASTLDRERYEDVETNPIKLVAEEPVSTFSIDADTASYSNVRRFLSDGELPPRDAVRVEELINYFDYDYPLPAAGGHPFAPSVAVAPTPWNADTQIVRIGLKGFDVEKAQRPNANIVFLLDVSGSMNDRDKLPLVKKAVAMAVDQFSADDRVSIVVYAGAAGAILEPTPGDQKAKILAALEQLEAGGSTAGGEGLRLAYALAEANFDKDAVNRVILATDGDFNVGVTSDERLEDFVTRKRETGVYLSVFGFGRGNYNDQMMQAIAQAGNGTAAYIDTLREARKVLNDELSSTLFPIADDVKIQVEFNPARVAEYRLIGYETRALRREDFSNDAVDAGEIGAGHEVTALYEIAAPGSAGRRIEDSRYAAAPQVEAPHTDELAFLRVRYKKPGQDTSILMERPITSADAVARFDQADRETRFATAVAGFGQLLRADPYLAGWDFKDVAAIANRAKGDDAFGYRAEFVQLARAAATAAALNPLEQPSVAE